MFGLICLVCYTFPKKVRENETEFGLLNEEFIHW